MRSVRIPPDAGDRILPKEIIDAIEKNVAPICDQILAAPSEAQPNILTSVLATMCVECAAVDPQETFDEIVTKGRRLIQAAIALKNGEDPAAPDQNDSPVKLIGVVRSDGSPPDQEQIYHQDRVYRPVFELLSKMTDKDRIQCIISAVLTICAMHSDPWEKFAKVMIETRNALPTMVEQFKARRH